MKSRIARNPNIQSGAYCIRGTRIPVVGIRQCAKVWSHAKIMCEYPSLTKTDIDAAIAFRAPSDEAKDGG